jgi:hypothetical protein
MTLYNARSLAQCHCHRPSRRSRIPPVASRRRTDYCTLEAARMGRAPAFTRPTAPPRSKGPSVFALLFTPLLECLTGALSEARKTALQSQIFESRRADSNRRPPVYKMVQGSPSRASSAETIS